MSGSSLRTAPATNQPMSRDLVLSLLETALRTNELRYARRLCTSWLAVYPGDLQVKHYLARSFLKDKSPDIRSQAYSIAQEICKLDPEFVEAQQVLSEAGQLSGSSTHVIAKACVNALTHGRDFKVAGSEQVSSWAKNLHEARNALSSVRSGDYQQIEIAEAYIHKALVENPGTPLAAITHLQLVQSKGSMPKMAVQSLAQIYHERWPDCLQFQLTLADELMESGEANRAVSMLHQAVSKDITGQVAKRMWGHQHKYSSLWPVSLEVSNSSQNSPQNIAIPAAIAASMGWNQIGPMAAGFQSGETPVGRTSNRLANQPTVVPPSSYKSTPDVLEGTSRNMSDSAKTVQSQLEKMADEMKRPHVAREDGRFPIYVIFTTRGGLEALYGKSAFFTIHEQLRKLAKVVHGQRINKEFWGSLLFYADDPGSIQGANLKPAHYNDAWQLKISLSNLDAALEKRGERIGSVLIIGGPEVVPFHNLPNPVEDADNDVPSDNPYATRDGNYYVSDWPLGRISGGSTDSPEFLLKILIDLTNRYDSQASQFAWYHRLIQYIQELLRRGVSKKISSFGYTAAAWKRASLSVFRSIGEPNDLLVSPPIHTSASMEDLGFEAVGMNPPAGSASCLLLPEKRLAYFNLHGVPDGCEWYGQSDPTRPLAGPEFPVAMRPEDIKNSGSAPRLVFTEACYGANITGKTVEDAIALKFLASGTHALVGSTCISYGSLTTPLTSADLLGRVFWSLLQEGFPAGESLRRAKIHLAREMHRRQGFLDAEDQKTLISFVLFGDPLAQPFQTKTSPKVNPHLSDSTIPVPTVCEHSCETEADAPVSLETISHLKSVVEQYLPSMSNAKVMLSQERQSCSNICSCANGRRCGLSASKNKNGGSLKLQRRVVTLSKNIEQSKHVHRQYARLTLDDAGKIIKMVVSR